MLLVELAQIARFLINRERGHAAALPAGELPALVGGVQEPPLRVDREKRRIRDAFDRRGALQFSASQIHSININALALAARVRADVEQQFVRLPLRSVLGGGDRLREGSHTGCFNKLTS